MQEDGMSSSTKTPAGGEKPPGADDSLLGPKGDPAEGARDIPRDDPQTGEPSDADKAAERTAADRR
jgi:hypothetical protein